MMKFWHDHSLTIILGVLTVLFHVLYTLSWYYDWAWVNGFAAEWGAGIGAAIIIILATKKYREKGSPESK